jgi:hypothetical protein
MWCGPAPTSHPSDHRTCLERCRPREKPERSPQCRPYVTPCPPLATRSTFASLPAPGACATDGPDGPRPCKEKTSGHRE